MNIEELLTEKDLQEIKSRAKEMLLKQVIALMNPGQIAAEIRNEAIKSAAKDVSEKVFREKHIYETLNRAVSSVEGRLNNKLHKMLSGGISVKFSGLNETGE